MSAIRINDLQPIGAELLLDSESYLNEVTADELRLTQGGISPYAITALVVFTVAGTAYALGRWGRRKC